MKLEFKRKISVGDLCTLGVLEGYNTDEISCRGNVEGEVARVCVGEAQPTFMKHLLCARSSCTMQAPN